MGTHFQLWWFDDMQVVHLPEILKSPFEGTKTPWKIPLKRLIHDAQCQNPSGLTVSGLSRSTTKRMKEKEIWTCLLAIRLVYIQIQVYRPCTWGRAMIQIGLSWWFQAHMFSSRLFGRVTVHHKLACVEMGWNKELDFKCLVYQQVDQWYLGLQEVWEKSQIYRFWMIYIYMYTNIARMFQPGSCCVFWYRLLLVVSECQ